jgi:hypothetical protein
MIMTFVFSFSFSSSASLDSSSSREQVIINAENRSMLTWNVTRFDDQMIYQCVIQHSTLVQTVRLEQQLHVKCKHRRKTSDACHLLIVCFIVLSCLVICLR